MTEAGISRIAWLAAKAEGSTPWSWASLLGLGTEAYWVHVRHSDGSWCNIDFAPLNSVHWLESEKWPTLICNQCERSDAWHRFHLCEDGADYQRGEADR